MSAAQKPLDLMRRAAGPAVALIIIAYFLGAAVIGDNGVMSWGEYRAAKTERQAELARLQQEHARLAHRAQLLDPRRTDPDLAEEMTRRELGVVRSDEVVVPLD
ncbi:MAG: FtsB family cell division protein [Allosphingosinicella sp.]|uniref:FtsB family cell division protein n=1 Tax=Allosphingosinicella sp. TaxID=2823234 RepID=UPI003949439A